MSATKINAAPAVKIPAGGVKFAKASRKRLSWFTLAELVVVVTILAILATVGFLALSGYTQDAKDATVKSNVRSVMTAISSESAVTNNSPRYYVVHDTGAALSDGAVAYVDGNPVALTGGQHGTAGTNYSAGNPDWAKLKLNPEKFRLSALPARLAAAFSSAEAAYDPESLSVGAVDAALPATSNGRARSASFFQVAGTAQATGLASVSGNFPAPAPAQVALWAVSGLVKSPSGTGALVDGGISGAGSSSSSSSSSSGGGASRYPGCDTDDIYLTGSSQYWAACNVGATTAYSNQSVALADATAAGGPTAAQKAYMGAYYQWGRNVDVTTGGAVAGPLATATAASETRFITNSTSPFDWITPQNHNLWGGAGSDPEVSTYSSLGSPAAMQGPCATGYHVPTPKEWCDAVLAVSPDVTSCGASNFVEATANKFVTTLRLPFAGTRSRSTSAFANQGTTGRYWTSLDIAPYSYHVHFSSTQGVTLGTAYQRTFGASVRCVKN